MVALRTTLPVPSRIVAARIRIVWPCAARWAAAAVVAVNADTGADVWWYDPKAYEDGRPPNGTGYVHRGVAAWRDRAAGDKLRIFINSRYRLICLDGATGLLVDSFGNHGAIDLSEGLVWAINKLHYTN